MIANAVTILKKDCDRDRTIYLEAQIFGNN